MSFREKCTTVEKCMPESPFRDQIAKLHGEMLLEISCLKVQVKDRGNSYKAKVEENEKLRATLKEVSGCQTKHNTEKLCDGYIPPDGLVSKYPNLNAILIGTIAGNFREWPMVRRELQTLDGDINRIIMESAAYDALLTDICNEFMDVGADGKFFGSKLAERANKLLGI